MKRNLILFMLICFTFSCSTTKKKGELSKLGKLYHNTTSKYNGYFNAQELLKKSILQLEESNEDNYDELLNVYAYQSDNPEIVYEDLNLAIEKVATVVHLHRNSKWVDDCYLLLGKAQYLKQDYESAEETFRFFQEEFDARNIYPTGDMGGKQSAKEERKTQNEIKRKEKEEDRKIKAETREEEKKVKEEEKKDKKKAREDLKKEEEKLKKKIKKLRDNLKKAEKKRKDQEKKAREKARKDKKRLPKKDPNADPRSEKEKEFAAKLESAQKELKELKEPTVEEETEAEAEETDPVVEDEAAISEADGEPKEEEDELAEEEEEKDDKDDEGAKGGLFKHKPAYYKGQLWLARTFAERDNSFSSEYMLNNLKAEANVYSDIKKELPVSYAQLYIKQKDYPKAVVALNDAIEHASNKFEKARYAYIMGQLYEQGGQVDDALASFERSKNFKPKYEMSFHASLKQITLSHDTGKMSQDVALSKLGKMLKEDKNEEYRSQIQIARGEIFLAAGNDTEAIASFRSALSEEGASRDKKAEIYYKLATMFYAGENYVEASSYYDSTLQVINKDNSKFSEVERRAKNLQGVASNIQIIQLQDSLLALANLSDEEQYKIAENIYEERKLTGKPISAPSLSKDMTDKLKKDIIRRVGRERSSFFAYNPVAVSQGQRDFKRKWGTRQLEDNWRRSARADATLAIEEAEELEEEDTELKDAEIRKIIAEIPNSPARAKEAMDRIEEAMYALGVAYRNDVADFAKSAETLENFLEKYPSSEHGSELCYYQYLNYLDLNDKAKADYYANKLKTDYVDSVYYKILFDPSYVESFVNEEEKEEIFYNETYAQFQNDDFASVITRAEHAKTEFGKDNEYAAKYALLSAMSTGNIEGKDAYIKSLKSLTKRFPNTPEQVRASEILRFLDGKGDAFTSSLLNEEDLEAFKMEDDKLHYGVVVLYDVKEKQVNDSKISISDYHKKYFKLDKLKITSVHLNRDEKTQIILVRKFRNKEKADLYFKSISAKSDEYFLDDVKREFFVITQRNYRELLKQKSPVGYMKFFEDNYVK